MHKWRKQIQTIVDEIDRCIIEHRDEALTLGKLSTRLGYSTFHTTRQFRAVSRSTIPPGRIMYFYHNPNRHFKYIRPIVRD